MPSTLTFRIELLDTEPLVARTFKASPDMSMYQFHFIVQIVMGWHNCHLYQLDVGDLRIREKLPWDDEKYGPLKDHKEVTVGEVFAKVGSEANYVYDHTWYHSIECVDISTSSATTEALPTVVSGENACPPEDCGGSDGFEELVTILKNPKHSEYYDKLEWLEDVMGLKNYDPKYYNVEMVNNELGNLDQHILRHEYHRNMYRRR